MKSSLSFLQKFFKAILPADSFDEMKKESNSWMLQCPNCKHERSIWEMGGIRWKAAGNPKVFRRCPKCRKGNWQRVYQKI